MSQRWCMAANHSNILFSRHKTEALWAPAWRNWCLLTAIMAPNHTKHSNLSAVLKWVLFRSIMPSWNRGGYHSSDLCQHPHPVSSSGGSHWPMWLQVGDNGNARGMRVTQGGTLQDAILIPKGVFGGLGSWGHAYPDSVDSTWEWDILCLSLFMKLWLCAGRHRSARLGQAQAGQYRAPTALASFSLILRMNFNFGLAGSWLRESFPSCSSAPWHHYLNQILGPFGSGYKGDERIWMNSWVDKLVTSNSHENLDSNRQTHPDQARGKYLFPHLPEVYSRQLYLGCYRTLQLLHEIPALILP